MGDLFGKAAFQPQDTPEASPVSIFISYARADDEEFVKRLYHALISQGFRVWWDRKSMPNRGLTFGEEIRDAIIGCDTLILVVGPAAARSDYVGAEWKHAWKKGKRVIPILRLGDYSLIPSELELSLKHAPDFRVEKQPYREALNELLRLLHEPPLPLGNIYSIHSSPPTHEDWRVERSQELDSISAKLRIESLEPKVATPENYVVVLHGPPGIGKTWLASMLCNNLNVRRSFPDGIFWVELGENFLPVTPYLQSIGETLGDKDGDYSTEDRAILRLAKILSDKKCLIVLDDVWHFEHLRKFVPVLGNRSRILVTTRQERIALLGGNLDKYCLGEMEQGQALQLFRKRAGLPDTESNYLAEEIDIVRLLGQHPLAVSIAAALIFQDEGRVPELLERLVRVRESGRPFGDLKIDEADRDHNLEYSLRLSYDALAGTEAQRLKKLKSRFRSLGVFAPTGTFDIDAIQAVWRDEDQWTTRTILDEFIGLSLLLREDRHYKLHSLLRTYAHGLLVTEKEDELVGRRHLEHYRQQVQKYMRNSDWRDMLAQFEQYQQATKYAENYDSDAFASLVFDTIPFLGYMQLHEIEEQWLQMVLQQAVSRGDRDLQAKCYKGLARWASVTEQTEKSVDYTERLRSLSEEPLNIAESYFQLILIEHRRGNWQQAVEVFQRGLEALSVTSEWRVDEKPALLPSSIDLKVALAESDVVPCFIELNQLDEALLHGLHATRVFRATNPLDARRVMSMLRVMRYRLGDSLFAEVCQKAGLANPPVWLYTLMLPPPLPHTYLSRQQSNKLDLHFYHMEKIIISRLDRYRKAVALTCWRNLFPVEKQELLDLVREIAYMPEESRSRLFAVRPDLHHKLRTFGFLITESPIDGFVKSLNGLSFNEILVILEENQAVFLSDDFLSQLSKYLESHKQDDSFAQLQELIQALLVLAKTVPMEKLFQWVRATTSAPDELILWHVRVLLYLNASHSAIERRIVETNPELLTEEADALLVVLLHGLASNENASYFNDQLAAKLKKLRDIRRYGVESVLDEPCIESNAAEWVLFLSANLQGMNSWLGIRHLLSTYPEALTDNADQVLWMLTERFRLEGNAVNALEIIIQREFLRLCREETVDEVISVASGGTSKFIAPHHLVAGILEFSDARNLEETRNSLQRYPELLSKQALMSFDLLIRHEMEKQEVEIAQHLIKRRHFLEKAITHSVEYVLAEIEDLQRLQDNTSLEIMNLVMEFLSAQTWEQTALFVLNNLVLLEQDVNQLLIQLIKHHEKYDDPELASRLHIHLRFLELFRIGGPIYAISEILKEQD